MIEQGQGGAAALEVVIDIAREAGGFVSAWVYSPAGALLVVTPPCDSQAGAVDVAEAMWRQGELILTPSLPAYGNA